MKDFTSGLEFLLKQSAEKDRQRTRNPDTHWVPKTTTTTPRPRVKSAELRELESQNGMLLRILQRALSGMDGASGRVNFGTPPQLAPLGGQMNAGGLPVGRSTNPQANNQFNILTPQKIPFPRLSQG